jgi:hypothetical protein
VYSKEVDDRQVVGYEIKLGGRTKYKICRRMKRSARVGFDPILHLSAVRFSAGMEVRVTNNTKELDVLAVTSGIDTARLKKRRFVQESYSETTWSVEQLLFPGDGLTLVIKKV